MKKTVMFMMALFVSMLCVVPVYAAEEQYAKVTENTASDSLKDEVRPYVEVDSVTHDVTVIVSGGTYELLPRQDDSGHGERPDGYTWVGLSFELPKGSKDIQINGTAVQGVDMSGDPVKFDEWFGFNDEMLKTAAQAKENYEKLFTLTWNDEEDGPHTQKINLVVFPANVVVKEVGGATEKWNNDEYLKESHQKKLPFSIVYVAEEEGFQSSVEVLYFDENATAEEVKAQLLSMVGDLETLEIEGIYSDIDMSVPFDFEKDLDNTKIAYINLVSKKVVETEENPSTGDNVLTYAVMGIVALVSVLGTALYFKKVNE